MELDGYTIIFFYSSVIIILICIKISVTMDLFALGTPDGFRDTEYIIVTLGI